MAAKYGTLHALLQARQTLKTWNTLITGFPQHLKNLETKFDHGGHEKIMEYENVEKIMEFCTET